MEKLDLTKTYKSYFTAKKRPELVVIEPAHFVSISGKGDPSDQPFLKRIETLYSTAYTIKFMHKNSGKDFTVSKLEALWWFDETKFNAKSIVAAPTAVPRSEWEYRLLIRMPDFVDAPDVKKAVETVIKKGRALARDVEYFAMNEGKSAQMLHVGPFSNELETLQKLGEFITANRLERNGLHHEIYLSDFRRTAPEKLRTILREPVE